MAMGGQLRLELRPGEFTVAQVLERIRRESRDEVEKGRWFENLVSLALRSNAEYEVSEVHRWADWPEREALTGLDGRDIGIDLAARHRDGSWIAIQCKCYAEDARVGKPQIDSFIAASQREPFRLRWIVATCRWTDRAEAEMERLTPALRRIDFLRHADDRISEEVVARPVQSPWPLQANAIDDVVVGLGNHDRGRLIMACGTGKTFTALRIAERIVPERGRILFLAPSIALVSQARREWLRHTTRKLVCLVVCSDATAGGRGENEDIRLSELECAVSSDSAEIAAMLAAQGDATRVVFSTYQSLRLITAAQRERGAPAFDLALMDEAHRTTGVDRAASDPEEEGGFQAVHRTDRLHSAKRLYMTATPRIYTARSRGALEKRGIETVDMNDLDVYGPELHRLPFTKAVDAEMLSDYRVIVLGVHEDLITPGLRSELVSLGEAQDDNRPVIVRPADMTRLIGTSLALNGMVEGRDVDRPGRLRKTIAFANSIARSRFFAKAMEHPQVRRATTTRMRRADADAESAMRLDSRHLDASHSALERSRALRALARADRDNTARLLCNVKLFGEGVDVPSLDAIVFMEPRNSQVEIVQAVGRVMRRSEGKRFGYIVVPVPIAPGEDIADALAQGADGYEALGRVLRALQAHDGRLAEDPLRFVQVYPTERVGGEGRNGDVSEQMTLDLESASEGLYAQVVAASGLGKPGLLVSQEIEYVVRTAARTFEQAEMQDALAEALGLPRNAEARSVCIIAALLLTNACLLHRRLCDVSGMSEIPTLNEVSRAKNVKDALRAAWRSIMDRDYAPVFEPALAVIDALPARQFTDHALRRIAECANGTADSLSALGYDHSGPLYHRILPTARSDGAFYTNHLSALMLARLAIDENFTDWSAPQAIGRLRIMDPACGTGTLLMAALHVIKTRAAEAQGLDEGQETELHRRLVEDVLCGLDINRHAVQLAACNLTLGAPTVDYRRMNLWTLKHGPQPDGDVRAGSLEILGAAQTPLQKLVRPLRNLTGLEAEQVNEEKSLDFPLKNLDMVIMNPPFTNNTQRNRYFSPQAVRQMQQHEVCLREEAEQKDSEVLGVIDSNSIRTYFTPLADGLLSQRRGVLAKVIPATACVGASGLGERRFLAKRFHVERVITSHDPRRINFSENTSIHECLLIARRRNGNAPPPTEFVSLRKMPATPEDALAAADAIAEGRSSEWGQSVFWPAERMEAGDWTPVQWFNGTLARAVHELENSPLLEPIGRRHEIGPDGRGIRGVYAECGEDAAEAVPVFWSIGSRMRRTMRGAPERWCRPKPGKEGLAERYWRMRSHVLIAQKYDTISGRLTALWSPQPSIGSGWVPIAVSNEHRAKGLAAWWNATPARLMLLNRRSKKLTYPAWSLAQLRDVRIPKPDNPAWESLAEAWTRACEMELLPLRQAQECPARRIIDEAAAQALGAQAEQIKGWRELLAKEPTISNAAAPPNRQ